MHSEPVFIDTHIHGAFGEDVSDASYEGMMNLARRLPEFGVKAFCPTTMTISEDNIMRCFDAVTKASVKLKEEGGLYSEILGVHLEGPFMSPNKAGVQNRDYCISPSKAGRIIDRIESHYPGLLKIIDVAPELDGGIDFIRQYSSRYIISLAHTEADYDIACEAFEAGAQSVTHLLNAMNSCGIHISPPVLRMLFELMPEDRIIVVSDAMRGAGMPDGMYKLADADVTVKGGRTYYGEGGNLAGSVTNMSEEASRLISFGVAPEKVLKACVDNPLSRLKFLAC